MSKWISVKDRLPKYGERVLITEGAAVFEAYRSASGKWVRMGIGWAEDVTHWMPLPAPPEEPEVAVEENSFLMQRFMKQE